MIISYAGYSPPKCTCNGRTTHLSKTCKFLLKCLYVMDEKVTHPFPCLESSLTPSRMPKPNVSKTLFSKQKLFILENLLPRFGKYIGLPSEANYWIIFLKQSWVSLRDELLDHSPRQFFGKSSLEIPFTIIFHFLSCHALTPITLGSPVHMKCNMPFHHNSC